MYQLKKQFWPLIKGPQTGLLLLTGITGYMSARCPVLHPIGLFQVAGSLFLSISGCTVLNMWYDRDIDAKMERTAKRPLSTGEVTPQQALYLGLCLSSLGLFWSFALSFLYGMVVLAGLFFDLIIYTILLKRRTAWAIVWGGISGGMPILAGRVYGAGIVDWLGIMFALAVIFWIPTHILTFQLRYNDDYQNAHVPTIPSRYGIPITRVTIATASFLSTIAMVVAAIGLGAAWGTLRLLAVLSSGLLLLAIGSLFFPSERVNFGLFKYASIFMLSAMLLIAIESL